MAKKYTYKELKTRINKLKIQEIKIIKKIHF